MKAEFKRDMNHNYLILPAAEEMDTDSYQVRMMVGNGISSLLQCHVQVIDGVYMIYYDITSRQQMSSFFEKKKMGIEDLQMIFGNFIQVAEEMSEYLLNSGNLIIQPEFMYLNVEKREILFCYLPGYQKDIKEQFQSLTEYILPKIAHDDEAAVILGYGVYRRALEDFFHLEHIKEELFQSQGKKEISAEDKARFSDEHNIFLESDGLNQEQDRMEITDKEIIKRGMEDEFSERQDNLYTPKSKPVLWKKILGCSVGAGVIMLISVLKILGYLPWLEMEVVLGMVAFGAAAAMLGYICRKKLKKEKATQKEEERSGIIWEADSVCRDIFTENTRKEGEPTLAKKNSVEKTRNSEEYGETVILSVNPVKGPASLVSREPGELATIYLQGEITVIGKLETAADAVINLPTVSRVHAKVRKRENEYYLMDLNSRNGTSVNGRMLEDGEDYLLKDQDEVDFAQARYIFVKF